MKSIKRLVCFCFFLSISFVLTDLSCEEFVDSGEDSLQEVSSSILLSDRQIDYNLRVGVISKENRGFARIDATLNKGQTQIFALGTSDGGNRKVLLDTPLDYDLMVSQGFHLVDVIGDKDARSEVWLRNYSDLGGSSDASFTISGHSKGVGWALATLDVKFNLDNIKANVVKSGSYATHERDGDSHGWIHMKKGDTYNKRKDFVRADFDFKLIAAFFDDPYDIDEADQDDRMVAIKKYGDGDLFFFGIWGEQESVNDRIHYKRYSGSKWGCDIAIISAGLNIELPPESELLVNPGAETGDLEGWVKTWGVDASVINDDVNTDNYSFKVSGRDKRWHGIRQNITSVLIENGHGKYDFKAFVKANEDSLGKIQLKLIDSVGTRYFAITKEGIGPHSFTELSGSRIIGWNGELVYAHFAIVSGNEVVDTLIIDDLSLKVAEDAFVIGD